MPTPIPLFRSLRAAILAAIIAAGVFSAQLAVAQQSSATDDDATAAEAKHPRGNAIFDAEHLKAMRHERRVMIQQQRAERDAHREMLRNNVNHPAIRAGIEARRTHMERLARLDRIKQIGEQNQDQALIDRALAARDLELRRYFMWRTYHRATTSELTGIIPQTDTTGE
ncbi:hypothetical protein FRC98_00340 [Lujinxingia vulgaris]|uniref:Periplasmic heavy metal sensor n=1 Tax=Lujinxingia vulgaris TaxID=2600176 RepID=A0A5C6XAA4_9DELT|nr:hypothetical protein [Lujinxingia vulgaris]TXD38887.1 hypothetical protein FRC98_00340 [Lujinxingia vulgaris]